MSSALSTFNTTIEVRPLSKSGVWRKSGEAQNLSCLKSSVKFPKSVMISGTVTSADVGPLRFIKSKVNAAIYQEILEHSMLPSADNSQKQSIQQ